MADLFAPKDVKDKDLEDLLEEPKKVKKRSSLKMDKYDYFRFWKDVPNLGYRMVGEIHICKGQEKHFKMATWRNDIKFRCGDKYEEVRIDFDKVPDLKKFEDRYRVEFIIDDIDDWRDCMDSVYEAINEVLEEY